MCESTVYIRKKGGEPTVFMKDVAKITFEGGKALCVDILGERKEIANATLVEAHFVNHAMTFEENA